MNYEELKNKFIRAFPILRQYDMSKNSPIGKMINCILLKHNGIECPKELSYTYRKKHGLLNYDVRVWGSEIKNYFEIEKIFKKVGFKEVYCKRWEEFNNCFFKAPDLSYVLNVLNKTSPQTKTVDIDKLVMEVNKIKKELKQIRQMIEKNRSIELKSEIPKLKKLEVPFLTDEYGLYPYIA